MSLTLDRLDYVIMLFDEVKRRFPDKEQTKTWELVGFTLQIIKPFKGSNNILQQKLPKIKQIIRKKFPDFTAQDIEEAIKLAQDVMDIQITKPLMLGQKVELVSNDIKVTGNIISIFDNYIVVRLDQRRDHAKQ